MNKLLYLFSLCALATLLIGNSADAQLRKTQVRNAGEVIDLNQFIGGFCGCTDCDGIPEHNNPTDEVNGFFLATRWTATVLSGGGLALGEPTMVTWSIAPDGTDANSGGGFVPSNLISTFDNLFNEPNAGSPDLTNRFWFGLFEQALDRWGELGGLEYVYEPNDDGLATFTAGGALGVRGDVRIGGFNIDGAGGTLAFNSFPNNGDMAIDTADSGLFGSAAAGFRLFRNVVTHEQGHGIGFAHVVSNNAGFLMEPFISGAFDGPQLDDVRAVHRGYGDVFEKGNDLAGNDSISNATDLGTLTEGQPVTIGTDGATGTFVLISDDDFVSIDDNGDTDFFRVTVEELGFISTTLTPVGATYNQSPEGGPGATPLNTSAQSNLTLALFNSSGSPEGLVNNAGLGGAETLNDILVPPGDYFIRVTGTANTVQLYTLSVSVESLDIPVSTGPTLVSPSTGVVTGGGVGDLLVADNSTLDLQPTVPEGSADEPIVALFTLFAPEAQVTSVSFSYEGSGNTPNLNQALSVFNTDTGLFEELDSRQVTLGDSNFQVTPDGNPQDYVSFPSGLILIEMAYQPTGPVFLYPWTISIDRLVTNTLGQ